MNNSASLLAIEINGNTYTPSTYLALMEDVVNQGKTTGENQSEDLAHYTKMNLHRMQRLNKTLTLDEGMIHQVQNLKVRQTWYIITEAWCGDAAQNIPVFIKASEYNPLIRVILLLRDENLDIMDQYLTGGSRSIPKVISLDEKGNELFIWGPRPAAAQVLFTAYKENPQETFSEFVETIQRWYNQDKSQSLQTEIMSLLASVLQEK
jgi:uncharacterized protein YjdB